MSGAEKRRVGGRRTWAGAVLGLVLLALAFVLLRGRGGNGESGTSPEVAADTATARRGDFPVTVRALGMVVPGPAGEARPAAPAATRVVGVLVAEGDAVSAGQPLVQLDTTVLGPQLSRAQAALAAARESRARVQRLVDQGIAARKDLEAAEAELARARADEAEARRNRAFATVRSPIAGVVASVDVTLGAPVDANQPLVRIVATSDLSIVFRLSPEDADRVRRGADVSFAPGTATPAAESASWTGHGTVAGVGASVDPATGGVPVRVVPDSLDRPLRAGESVLGRITVAVDTGVVIVPLPALVPGEGETHVFVVDADGVAHETLVQVGGRTETEAEISSGLEGGEVVATEGAYGMVDGARVQAPGGP